MAMGPALDESTTRVHRVTGGGGVQLHVEETGNRAGRPVLFIHGLSQSRLAWHRQLHSALGRDLRLVALDLRGHGRSERRSGAYGDPVAWAEDVAAVIRSLDLERPILSGWSYGGVVICDYLRCHGADALGGVQLVGATTRLGEPAMPFLGPDFLATVPGLFSVDVGESMASVEKFVRLLTVAELSPEDHFLFFGATAAVPPGVRQELLSRSLDHDTTLRALDVPVLITHGLEDDIVLPAMAEHNASLIAGARSSYYPNVGHATFWEAPDRFNSELRAFADSL